MWYTMCIFFFKMLAFSKYPALGTLIDLSFLLLWYNSACFSYDLHTLDAYDFHFLTFQIETDAVVALTLRKGKIYIINRIPTIILFLPIQFFFFLHWLCKDFLFPMFFEGSCNSIIEIDYSGHPGFMLD
jgi:hypothetical protein